MKPQETRNSNKKNTRYSFYNLKILLIILIILITYFLFGKLTGYYFPCVFHKVTGFYCPGCGITRLFLKLLDFDVVGAFRCNQLVFCLIPMLLTYLLLEIRKSISGKRNFMNGKNFYVVWVMLVIISIMFGVLRNLETFSFLAPPSL